MTNFVIALQASLYWSAIALSASNVNAKYCEGLFKHEASKIKKVHDDFPEISALSIRFDGISVQKLYAKLNYFKVL